MTTPPPASPSSGPDLLDSLRAIIWEANPETFQFRYVNRAAAVLVGYSLEDWLSRSTFWADLLHPDDRDSAVAQRRAAVHEGRDHDLQYRVIAADGSIRCFRDIASVLRGGAGEGDRLRGLMVDVTDAKAHLEAALQRADRTEAIAHVTGAVAHDFRNVLFVIRGNADLALEKEVGAHVREELAEIRDAANVGVAIVEGLTTFGGGSRRLTVVDVNDAIRRVRAILARLLRPVAELAVETSAARTRVLIDSGALHQIVLNLVINAKEAMAPTGGRVAITTRNVPGSAPGTPREARDFVEIEVSDTGVGMLPHIRERIFELHFTTKKERRGTGIGLATVAAIVRDAGGTISVETEPHKGSTFRVRLPVVEGGS